MFGAGRGRLWARKGAEKMFFWSGKLRTLSPISRLTIFTNFAHNNVDRCRDVNRTEFWKFCHNGSFFQKKQKLPENFPIQTISGRHNSAMITDRRIHTAKLNLYRMSSFHCYCWNQFKVIPLSCTLRTVERTYPNSLAVDSRTQITHYAIYL